MIKLDVSKRYKKEYVFKNLNYKFADVGLYLVTGKSGKGKTTLLNIIGGVDHKYDGKIYSDNSVLYFKDKDFLVSSLSVKENLFLFELVNNVKIKDYFDLSLLLKKKIKKLSLGEKQLVVLTLALNSPSKTIILDEPFSALSQTNINKACLFIEKISEEKLIIIATHTHSFNDYKELNMEKYSKRKLKDFENRYVRKEKKYKFKYYLFYLKKVFFKKLIFIFSIILILISFCKVKDYENLIKEDYLSLLDIESSNIISKSNVLKEINEDVFYELVKKLSMYISNYNANYYNELLYKKDLMVNSYYIDNAFSLSIIEYVEEDLKDNEIIVGINYQDFCVNNSVYSCEESYLKTLLLNKKIEDFNLYVKDIFESETTCILSNKRFHKILSNNSYIEYYFDVKKEYVNEAFYLINNDDLLNEFTYTKIGESEEEYRYSIELKSKSFKYPLNYNKYIVCLEKGYNCFNYLNHLETLVKVDNYEEKIDLKVIDQDLSLNEIVISCELAKEINKISGDTISLYFEYKGEIKKLEFLVKDVLMDNNYYIYHNSSFSYLLFSDLLEYDNEDLIIKNIVIYEDIKGEDMYEQDLYKEIIKEVNLMLNKINRIINLVNVSVTSISVVILLFLEFFYNKFKKEYNQYLKFI